jgi:hypothetical protein
MVIVAFVVLLVTTATHAQFYAPETRFHDVCQRHFAVEAARVLAWLDRRRGVPVVEVKYQLQCATNGDAKWDIRWLNGAGQELRSAVVSYPASDLTNGVGFYRKVFRQIQGASRLPSDKAATPAVLEPAFWDGANRAGYSRMESVEAAFELWKINEGDSPRTAQAAGLAGLLVQTATHGFWQESALDARLLARAAAWLCVAESPGTNLDSAWAPVLFCAGREWQARSLWRPHTNPPVALWWEALLSGLPTDKALMLASAPEQRVRAMPMLAWQGTISDGYLVVAGNLIEPWFGKPETVQQRLYDYAPRFADSTVENGHILDGWWPTLARNAWLKTLQTYPGKPGDYRGYTEAAAQARSAIRQDAGAVRDNSLRELEAMKPLLQLAYDEAVGPLIPVAHVTARDLLHFGWENAALQLTARHYFVSRKWGVPELAREILRTATNNIPQLGLLNSGETNSPQFAEALERLQYVNWTFGGYWPAAGVRTGNVLTNDLGPMTTHWLRPSMASWLYNWWLWAHPPAERRPVLTALCSEGGRRMNLNLLDFLTQEGRDLAELREFGATLTNGLPFATGLMADYLSRVTTNQIGVVPTPEQCRLLERLFWTNPNSTLAPRVFHAYLLAGEFPAAKAFHREAMSLSYDAVAYSLRMDSPRWLLAMFEGNQADMQAVLAENETGSHADFVSRINDALWHQDYERAEALIQAGIARYGAGPANNPSSLEIMRRVLALREALGDPKHSGHAHAVGYLTKVTTLPVFQWILIQNLKLNQADAVAFLGGGKNPGVRKLMVCYLQKDKQGFDDTLKAIKRPLLGSTCVVGGVLRSRLHDYQPVLEGKSIRPAGAQPIESLLLSKRHETP